MSSAEELRRSYADAQKNERKLWLELKAERIHYAEAIGLLRWLLRTGDPGVKGEPRWNARAAAFAFLDRRGELSVEEDEGSDEDSQDPHDDREAGERESEEGDQAGHQKPNPETDPPDFHA